MAATVRAFVALIAALVRGRPVPVHLPRGDGWLYPRTLRVFPAMAGGAPDYDEEDDDDPPPPPPDDDEEDDDDDPPPPPPEFDADRAMKTIRQQRKAEKEARKRAEKAEAELAEMKKSQESDAERVIRERDEAKAEAQLAKDQADRLLVTNELTTEAISQGVHARRLKKALRLVDRDDITVDNGEVEGADDAIEQLLKEFPELKDDPDGRRPPADDDEDTKPREKPGGKPDRRRQPKELTADQVAALAENDPDEFNRLFEEGKFTQKQLGRA